MKNETENYASFMLPSESQELEIMCDQFFSSDFVQNFRKYSLLVKKRCLAEAGRLIFLFTPYCLRNGYANFVVELLSDDDAVIRNAALKLLNESVYIEANRSLPEIRLFSQNCTSRFLNGAVDDPDRELCIRVIYLLTKINTLLPDNVFRFQDLHPVFRLTLEKNDERSQAAASLLHSYLQRQLPPQIQTSVTKVFADISNPTSLKIVEVDGNEQPVDNSNLAYLVNLWEFVATFGSASNVSTLVQNLAQFCPYLRDWKGFIYLLLKSRDGFYYGNPTTGFIVLLRSAVELVFDKSCKPPPDDDEFVAESRLHSFDEWRRMSDVILPALPRLIRHFIAMVPTATTTDIAVQQSISSHNIFLLLQLLPTLDLSSFHEKCPFFNDLLQCLGDVVEQTGNHLLLDAVARTFKLFEPVDFPGSVRFKQVFRQIVELYQREIVEALQFLCRRFAKTLVATSSSSSRNNNNNSRRPSLPYTLCVTISSRFNKLANIAQHFDLTELNLEQQAITALQLVADKSISYNQLAEVAIRYVINSLSWLSFSRPPSKDENPNSKTTSEKVRPLIHSLMTHLVNILPQLELSSLAYNSLLFLRKNYSTYCSEFDENQNKPVQGRGEGEGEGEMSWSTFGSNNDESAIHWPRLEKNPN